MEIANRLYTDGAMIELEPSEAICRSGSGRATSGGAKVQAAPMVLTANQRVT